MDNEVLQEYYTIIKDKISQARFSSAIGNIEKMLINFPDNADAYYYLGVCKFAVKKYKESVFEYQKAIFLDATHAKAYFNLGVSYYVINNFDNALINIAKALILFSKKREPENKQRCVDALKFIQIERKSFK